MRKLRKLCIVLSLLLVLSFFVAVPASAASLITSYNGEIHDTGSLRITWSASTACNINVDQGSITSTIQYKSGGSWTTIAILSEYDTNTYVIFDGGNRNVSNAGEYRIKTTHFVREGTATQIKSYTSPTINVN